jgi:3',5'-cyclic-AMP phosphodiesterase
MLIAQISDTHITPNGRLAYGRVDTERMLRQCVQHVCALNPEPDVVVVTGDLVDAGRADEYELFAQCLAPLRQPILLIVGNHDDRENLRATLKAERWSYLRGDTTFVQYAITFNGLRFVGIDTLIPGSAAGGLCEERLTWLESTLDASTAPTVILMHHPPFRTGIESMDSLGLARRDDFARVVAKYPQVKRILCGHLHRSIHATCAGVATSTASSPAHQLALNLGENAPERFVMEPPGYHLHQWQDHQFVTHHVVIGLFDGPYPFVE